MMNNAAGMFMWYAEEAVEFTGFTVVLQLEEDPDLSDDPAYIPTVHVATMVTLAQHSPQSRSVYTYIHVCAHYPNISETVIISILNQYQLFNWEDLDKLA